MKSLLLLLAVLPLAFCQTQKVKTACKCAHVECPAFEPDVRIDLALPAPMLSHVVGIIFFLDKTLTTNSTSTSTEMQL